MQQTQTGLFLVSSCLTGLCTRYDCQIKTNAKCLERLEQAAWIPVCPEQLGGLTTPREPADIIGGNGHDVLTGKAHVITKTGEDVSRQFIQGAQQVLKIATAQQVQAVFLKEGSPSCGVHKPCGVTAALLLQHGFILEEF